MSTLRGQATAWFAREPMETFPFVPCRCGFLRPDRSLASLLSPQKTISKSINNQVNEVHISLQNYMATGVCSCTFLLLPRNLIYGRYNWVFFQFVFFGEKQKTCIHDTEKSFFPFPIFSLLLHPSLVAIPLFYQMVAMSKCRVAPNSPPLLVVASVPVCWSCTY